MPLQPNALTAASLFDYCDGFARRAEAAGRGTEWPSVREVKRRFPGSTYQDIEDAIANYTGPGYMGLATGTGITGAGTGHAAIARQNDHSVEAYE